MTRPALLAILLALTGCRTAAPAGDFVTEHDIDTLGTQRYAAPADRVAEAVVGALRTSGFDIAFVAKDRSVIVTTRHLVHIALGTPTLSQWNIRITPVAGGATVRATPRVFAGELEIRETPRRYWNARWRALFAEIDGTLKLLSPAPTPATVRPPI